MVYATLQNGHGKIHFTAVKSSNQYIIFLLILQVHLNH